MSQYFLGNWIDGKSSTELSAEDMFNATALYSESGAENGYVSAIDEMIKQIQHMLQQGCAGAGESKLYM